MKTSETAKVIKEIRVYRNSLSENKKVLVSTITPRYKDIQTYNCVNAITDESRVVWVEQTRKGYEITYEIVGRYLKIFVSNNECETVFEL